MKQRMSLYWKIALCIAEFIGLGMGSGLFAGKYRRRFPYMFTNLSNIAVFVYFLLAILWMLRLRTKDDTLAAGGANANGKTFAPVLKHMVTMAVMVTMIISHLLLRDGLVVNGVVQVHLVILHYITPMMTILDWLFFEERGSIQKWEPFVWLLGPLTYFLWSIISIACFGSDFGANVAAGKSPYPYDFINPDKMGVDGVVKFILIAIAAFLILGYLMYAVDRIGAQRQKAHG